MSSLSARNIPAYCMIVQVIGPLVLMGYTQSQLICYHPNTMLKVITVKPRGAVYIHANFYTILIQTLISITHLNQHGNNAAH